MELTAYHESGHALMATLLGARVRSVTIEPDRDDGPKRLGDTRVVWSKRKRSERDFRERAVRVLLAGPVAEMIYRGETLHPCFVAAWSGDWNEAWELAEFLFVKPGDRMGYLERVTVDLYRLLNAEPYWSALAALADHLLAHETLETEDVHELIAQNLRIH